MMRQILLLFITALMCGNIAFAQTNRGSISGTVTDKNGNQPIEYATIALLEYPGGKIITGTITDSLGNFSLTGIKYGSYSILCSFIGYSDYTSSQIIISNENRLIKLGTITLDNSSQVLDEVVVSTRRSTYSQTIDKKIFNVGSDITSTSGAVSDLLQNVPSLQVDVGGNVALRGNENVQVLIDGKPSVM